MKIASLTACCVDSYPQIGLSFLGGNSLNFTAQARFSAPEDKVAVIAAIGKDENGKRIHNFLIQNSISVEYLHELEGNTATNQIINDEFGERFGVPGSWNGGVYQNFLLSAEDWVFALSNDIIAIPANNPNFDTLLEKKSAKNIIVVDFLDIENSIPIEKYIDSTDIAFITGREHLLHYFEDLSAKRNKLLIVTLGSMGSVAFFQGNVYRQEALKVPKVIDTTGCGDSYQAAFTVTYCKTKNIAKAMEAGAKAASFTLQHFGGVGV